MDQAMEEAVWEAVREQFRRRPEVDMEAHARAVVEVVAELLAAGEPGDREIALAAAILHDVGIPEAIARYGSGAPPGQEIEGAQLAREMLARLKWPTERAGEIAEIIGQHHRRLETASAEFRLLYDADLIVNAQEAGKSFGEIGGGLYAESARAIARRRLGQAYSGKAIGERSQ